MAVRGLIDAARILGAAGPIAGSPAGLDGALDRLGGVGLSIAILAGIALTIGLAVVLSRLILPRGIPAREMPRAPWGRPDAVLVFFLLTSFVAAIALGGGAERSAAEEDGTSRVPAILGDISFQVLFAGAIAGLAAIRMRGNPAAELGLLRPLRAMEAIALVGLLLAWLPALLGTFFGWLLALDRIGVRIDPQAPVKVLLDGSAAEKTLVIAFAVFIAPICEEIVFRGYLHGGLRLVLGRVPSLVLTASLFALFHHHLPTLPPILLLGLLLGLVQERSGSLWAPIALHALFNAGNVAASFLFAEFAIN